MSVGRHLLPWAKSSKPPPGCVGKGQGQAFFFWRVECASPEQVPPPLHGIVLGELHSPSTSGILFHPSQAPCRYSVLQYLWKPK